MDLDALRTARQDDWARLEELSRRGRRLTGPETDELVERYRAGAADLSLVQSTAGSSVLGDRLSVTLSRARLRFTGAPEQPLAAVTRFVAYSLPAALYRIRWTTVAVAVATVAVAGLWAWWALGDPRVLASLGSDAEFRRLVEHDFVDYYSANPAASFAGQVWTNNAWIAAQCIAFGITGVWVPYVVLGNAQNLGITAAVMFAYDEGDTFFAYIAPHGQLELWSVFVAAAAGLHICWSWIAPGRRTRLAALAAAGRSLVTVAIGTAFFLLVSGIVEGFVTPAPWPWPVKIGIGSLVWVAVLVYTWVVGRRAVRAGETGDLAEFDRGVRAPVAG